MRPTIPHLDFYRSFVESLQIGIGIGNRRPRGAGRDDSTNESLYRFCKERNDRTLFAMFGVFI